MSNSKWAKVSAFEWVLEGTSPPNQITMDSWEDADGVVLSYSLLVWDVMLDGDEYGMKPAGDFGSLEEAMAAGENLA
jgi:hypothetical protein